MQLFLGVRQNRVQEHSAVGGKDVVGVAEKGGPSFRFERFEGADGDDAVDLVVELFPALQPHLDAAPGRQPAKLGLAVLELVTAERDSDDVDIEFLDRSLQRSTPTATDV